MMGDYGEHDGPAHLPLPETKVDIGKREVVGFGGNGEVIYVDSVMPPFPAIWYILVQYGFRILMSFSS